MTSLIIGIVIAMMFSAFFSGMEIAFVSSNRMLAEVNREKGSITDRVVSTFYRHPNMFEIIPYYLFLISVVLLFILIEQ